MKRLIQIILIFLITGSAFAQTATEVLQNQSYVYNVTPADANLNYMWSTTGGTSTDVTTMKNDSVSILWDGADLSTHTLKAYAQDKTTLCKGNSKSKLFKIVTTLSYSATVGSFTNTCPQTNENTSGGNDASFTVSVAGTTVAGGETVTVQYAVLGEGSGSSTFAVGASSGTILLNTKNYTNLTGVSITKTVQITGVQISGRDGISFPVSARPAGTFSISASPEISDIQF